MRVLIDECVDPRVKTLLLDHQPATVHDQGWGAFEDGALLAAAQNEFDVLVTIDRKLAFQQNLAKFRIGVVVVRIPKNQLQYYRMIREELLMAPESSYWRSTPCSWRRIEAGMRLDDYKMVLYRNQPDGWVADVPAIPGCYALMATREEALAELEGVFQMIAAEYTNRG